MKKLKQRGIDGSRDKYLNMNRSERSTPVYGCYHISVVIKEVLINMKNEAWTQGIEEANLAFQKITNRGKKWMDRRIPIFIRQNLMVPWYISPGSDGEDRLFVIKYPKNEVSKVHFVEWN